MVTIESLSPLTLTAQRTPGSPLMEHNNRRRAVTVARKSTEKSPVGARGRRVSFYEGPRAPGPATSVISSPSLARSGSFSGSILKKTPTVTTPVLSKGPMLFPTSVTEPSLPSTKRGFLMKYSLGRSRLFGRRNWRKRWFDACPNGLAYYKTSEDKNFVLEIRFGPKDPMQCGRCKTLGVPRYTPTGCEQCMGVNDVGRPATFLRPNLSQQEFPYLDPSEGNIYFGLSFWQSDREFTLVMQAPDPLAKQEWVRYLHQFNSIHDCAVSLAGVDDGNQQSAGPFEDLNLESSCGSSSTASLDFTLATTDLETTPTTPIAAASSPSYTRIPRGPPRRSSVVRK